MAATLFNIVQMMGSGISAFGQWQAGQSQKAAYDYNARLTLEQTREEEEVSAQRYSRLRGRQAALYGKAGVNISSGSPLLILADTAMQEEEERERMQLAGLSKAQMQRYAGSMAAWSGTTGAFSTFLTGLGKGGLDILKRTAPWSPAGAGVEGLMG